MDAFQKIVLGISVFVLIVILIGFYYALNARSSSAMFPPVQQPCPDGWVMDSSGNCFFVGKNGGNAIQPNGIIKPSLVKDMTKMYPIYQATNNNGVITFGSGVKYPFDTPSNPPIDNSITNTVIFNINDSAWANQGGSIICTKRNFSNQYGIYWDGVTNTNQCTNN